eukprot:823248_1
MHTIEHNQNDNNNGDGCKDCKLNKQQWLSRNDEGDINSSTKGVIDLIQKGECEKDITKCKSIEFLAKRVETAIESTKNADDYETPETLDQLDIVDCTNILNNFHHILRYHDKNDEAFDEILKAFGGRCELEHCKKITRYYGVNVRDEHTRFIEDLLDRIHCYVHHGYDTFRFTEDERKQIQMLVHEEKESIPILIAIMMHMMFVNLIFSLGCVPVCEKNM